MFVRICDMCDEKFLRAQLQFEFKTEQRNQDILIKQNEDEFKQLKIRYEQKLNEYQEVRNRVINFLFIQLKQ